MQPLSNEYLKQCPHEGGFRLRGLEMTRIEVFVDAAFAFAVTMLVISIDQIPRSVPELVSISKQIPAFIISVALLVYIWHSHSIWSKRFGLEDGKTVFLSVSLLVVVLIFIYPLKMMFEGMFSFLSNGFLPNKYDLNSYDELRILFYYFAIGYAIISLLFVNFYKHALRYKKELKLSEHEKHMTHTEIMISWALIFVCMLAFLLSYSSPDKWVPITGFCYVIIWPIHIWIERKRYKLWLKRDN